MFALRSLPLALQGQLTRWTIPASQFLDLKRENMELVAKDMGEGTTVEDLVKTVEELSRSCH